MRQARGFTLIEVLVVLIIFATVISMAAAVTRGIAASQKRSLTVTRLAGVDAALQNFVAVAKRLPCPANGALPSTDPNAGLEPSPPGACTAQVNGVVPWRTLGISEQDATDGWDHRITYRTDPNLGITSYMDMSWCDPAGQEAINPKTTCNSACTAGTLASCTPPGNFLNGKGLQVQNTSGIIVMDPATSPYTGAAYVLISHGETGGGAYLYSGSLSTSTTTDGAKEKLNYANLGYGVGAGNTTYYVDDSIFDAAGNTHFDDIVSRPSVFTLISKAALGPRSH